MPEIIPNLHPLAVHFPIALISLSAIFHVAALFLRGRPANAAQCAVLAHSTLWLGALAALVAVVFGWQAFNSVNHDEAGHLAMLEHRAWALATLAVSAILAGWDAWRSKLDAPPTWWFAALVVGAWGLVAATAWHGGELVYRHGLGVLALPAGGHAASQPYPHGSVVPQEPHDATAAPVQHHQSAAEEPAPQPAAPDHDHSAHEH